MDYKLCKELKDAGFPQKSYYGWYFETPTVRVMAKGHDIPNPDWPLCPPLSDLIEACGERFICISKNPFEDKKSDELWVATAYGTGIERSVKYTWSGSTPEEAVAKLWLTLNKK